MLLGLKDSQTSMAGQRHRRRAICTCISIWAKVLDKIKQVLQCGISLCSLAIFITAAGMQIFVNVAIPLFLLCGRPLDLLHVPFKNLKICSTFLCDVFLFQTRCACKLHMLTTILFCLSSPASVYILWITDVTPFLRGVCFTTAFAWHAHPHFLM